MKKKIIIENYKDSPIFAILVITEDTAEQGYAERGFLSYFKVQNDGSAKEWEEDAMSFKANQEIANMLIIKAQEVCKENNVDLWSY